MSVCLRWFLANFWFGEKEREKKAEKMKENDWFLEESSAAAAEVVSRVKSSNSGWSVCTTECVCMVAKEVSNKTKQ